MNTDQEACPHCNHHDQYGKGREEQRNKRWLKEPRRKKNEESNGDVHKFPGYFRMPMEMFSDEFARRNTHE